MPFFEPFKLERYFAAWEFTAPYLLCSSDCESMALSELLAMEDGASERLAGLRLGYTESRGAPSLRKAISGEYPGLDPDSIIVHAGAEEGVLNLCLAALKPGDRVVVNFPCYQSLAEIPRAMGCRVVPWSCREEGGRWRFDPEELRALCAPGVRLIALNAPHNPTGALPTPAEFEAIVAVARRHGALLLVDEVYRRLEREPGRRLPSVCQAYENGVALDVLSKHAGLAGLRIGWLASRRKDLMDAVAVVKDYNSICASGPSEVLAEIALRHLDAIVERNRGLVSRNLSLLDAFFARWPDFASWTRPEGGSVAFPRLASGSDAEAMAGALVRDSGVLVLPGSCYGADRSRFRIGYGRANMPEALSRLESWLEKRGGRI